MAISKTGLSGRAQLTRGAPQQGHADHQHRARSDDSIIALLPAGTICARSLASSARGALRYGAFPVDEQASIKRLFDGEFRSA